MSFLKPTHAKKILSILAEAVGLVEVPFLLDLIRLPVRNSLFSAHANRPENEKRTLR